MAKREKKSCEVAFQFVRIHAGKRCFAPCTGQDYRALEAFAHLMALWCYSDPNGQEAAVVGMRAMLNGMQAKVWHLAKWVIPAIGDWPHVDKIWPQICSVTDDITIARAGTYAGSQEARS